LERGKGGFDDHRVVAVDEDVGVTARALRRHRTEAVEDVLEITDDYKCIGCM
jgi:hypothetical protein